MLNVAINFVILTCTVSVIRQFSPSFYFSEVGCGYSLFYDGGSILFRQYDAINSSTNFWMKDSTYVVIGGTVSVSGLEGSNTGWRIISSNGVEADVSRGYAQVNDVRLTWFADQTLVGLYDINKRFVIQDSCAPAFLSAPCFLSHGVTYRVVKFPRVEYRALIQEDFCVGRSLTLTKYSNSTLRRRDANSNEADLLGLAYQGLVSPVGQLAEMLILSRIKNTAMANIARTALKIFKIIEEEPAPPSTRLIIQCQISPLRNSTELLSIYESAVTNEAGEGDGYVSFLARDDYGSFAGVLKRTINNNLKLEKIDYIEILTDVTYAFNITSQILVPIGSVFDPNFHTRIVICTGSAIQVDESAAPSIFGSSPFNWTGLWLTALLPLLLSPSWS